MQQKILIVNFLLFVLPRIGTLSRAVSTSSKADANAFTMEFSFLRNKLVMIPRTALFITSTRTRTWRNEPRESGDRAEIISPWK